MKILQVTTHLNVGGIGNYIVSLSSMLKKKGAEVIVASCGGDLEDELTRCGIGHRRLDIYTKFEFSPKVFVSALKLARIVKEEGVDVIHAHSRVSQTAAFFASILSGVPVVTTCHGYFKKRARGIFDTWGKSVIAISDAVKNHLKDDLGVKEDRIELIYNGVDIDKFSKVYSDEDAKRIKLKLGLKDAPVIGTVGRLSSVKGQKFLIGAMKIIHPKMPDVQCVIVGSGDEEKNLKEMAASLGLKEQIYFFPSDQDTHKFLSVMDVFVFPSIKEGLGLALLEALASGCPCVASRVGGISDIITDGSCGKLVEVGNAGAIGEAILALLKDSAGRKDMAKAGRMLIKDKFSLEKMTDKVTGLYRKVQKK